MSAATGLQQYCNCHGSDDGRPMIRCDNCDDWFHFSCIKLDEGTAAEIDTFYCQACTEKTKQETIFSWQLTDEELSFAPPPVGSVQPQKQRQKPRPIQVATVSQPQVTTPVVPSAPPTFGVGDSDSDVAMKDDDGEYTGEHQLTRLRRGKQVRRAGSPSDGSLSPQDAKPRKRKATTALASTSKRKKTLVAKSPTPLSDPVRKYCYGKLLEVMEPIFLECRPLEPGGETELGEEEAKQLAAKYVAQLENAVFDHYSEPDKKGARTTGPKYKERFRMLTFNLGHSDRVSLRKGIASGSILAIDLAEMSSAALANEQAKQDMEKAAQEALHQSILKVQTSLPRAKITHKGEEVIESNVSSDVQRVGEEEERERVKMRLRVRTGSILDGNPESAALLSSAGVSSSVFGENRPMEIDSGTPISPEKAAFSPLSVHPPTVMSPQVTPMTNANTIASPVQVHATSADPTNPSPQVGPSFSLNTLWSGTQDNANGPRFSFSGDVSSPVGGPDDSEEIAMDLDEDQPGEQDFGMFLEGVQEKDPAPALVKPTTPPALAKELEASEMSRAVWTGELVMPLDPKPEPLVTKVTVRQVGGRPFGTSRTVWDQLFRSTKTVIDGRVATDRATKYLVSMRLNSTKELIVVAFDSTEASKATFNDLFDFLIKKDRHGLVFPWGQKPPPSAVGKDMYLIPLPASKPLPEFIDLLDHVQIPRKRKENMLLGVFVMHKGRIVPPPPQPITAIDAARTDNPPAPVMAPPPLPQNEVISSLFSNLGSGAPPAMPYGMNPPPAPIIPGGMLPVPSPGVAYGYLSPPMPMPPQATGPPPADALSALTSSIKNMTPDQINIILKGLAMAGPPPPQAHLPSWPSPAMPIGNPVYAPGGASSHNPYPSASRSPPRSRDVSREEHYSRDRERRGSPPFRGGRGEPRYQDDWRGPRDRRAGS